jgi:hypothetical protein
VTATNVDDGAADAIEKHVLRYFSVTGRSLSRGFEVWFNLRSVDH